jgi:hypothetical protein
VTQLMRLDYYDMDVEEMVVRLMAKSCGDAEPPLDFNALNRRSEATDFKHAEGESGMVGKSI